MPDAVELTKAIKRAAVEAVKAGKPAEICFGKVTSSSPLKILVEQKMTLGAAQLVLTRNVTNFTTEVTVDWSTENKSGGSGDASFASHKHAIAGRKFESSVIQNGSQTIVQDMGKDRNTCKPTRKMSHASKGRPFFSGMTFCLWSGKSTVRFMTQDVC